jgi:hypothetical protein
MRPVIVDAEAILALPRKAVFTKKKGEETRLFISVDRGEVYTTAYNCIPFGEDEEWVKKTLCDPTVKPVKVMKCVVMVDKESCPKERFSSWSNNFDKPKNLYVSVDGDPVAYLQHNGYLKKINWDPKQITNLNAALTALKKDWEGLLG